MSDDPPVSTDQPSETALPLAFRVFLWLLLNVLTVLAVGYSFLNGLVVLLFHANSSSELVRVMLVLWAGLALSMILAVSTRSASVRSEHRGRARTVSSVAQWVILGVYFVSVGGLFVYLGPE